MKTTKWHSRVVIALLLTVAMLFGVLAVSALAVTEPEDNSISYSEEWYSVKYIPATDTEKAKLDLRLSPEISSFSGIDKAALSQLKDRLFEVVYQLVYDSVMKEVSAGTASAEELSFVLLSEVGTGGIVIPDNIDLDNIDIGRLEQFIKDHFDGDEAKEKIQNFIEGDYDTVIAIAVDKYAANHTYEEIAAKADSVFAEVVEIVYADEPEVIEEVKASSSTKVVEIVEEVKTTTEAGEQITIEIKDIVSSLITAKIDGAVVYDDGTFILEELKSIVKELPTFAEIAEMDDTEMFLDYTVEAEFIFGVVDFDLTVGFEGDCSLIRSVAGIISDYVSFETLSDGTVSISVNVPEKASELLLRAIKSPSVSDELKHKVFTLMSKNAEDVNDYIQQLTFDEIIELLEGIDFENILDSEAISKHIDLSGLTNEEIIEKVKSFEGYYNKAVSLLAKVMNKLPESIKGKTLVDVYDGDGLFRMSVDKQNVDVEKVLTSISEKYGAALAAFLDTTTIDVKARLSISFASVNRVTFMADSTTVVGDGFLPEGADLAFFANKTSHQGRPIQAWVDAQGTEYEIMPDADIVLYAYYGGALTLGNSGDVNTAYTGSDIPLTVTVTYNPFGVNSTYDITYQWYKGEVAPENLIDGADAATFNVKNVADSGEYICVVTVDENGIITSDSTTFTVAITKRLINISGAVWNYDPTSPFFYDGTEKSVQLVGLPAGITVNYTDNKFVNAGNYTAVAEIVLDDSENTFLEGVINNSFQWEIRKATYDMSGISFKDKTVQYNGELHSILIEGQLPEGVTVQYSASQSEVGTYLMTATFVGNENYNDISPLTAVLVILPREIIGVDFSYTVDGEVVVTVTAKNPLGENVTLSFVDKSADYADFDFSSLSDGDVTFGGAYDISFMKDNAAFNDKNNSFTVRLLIPSALRSMKSLMVVHITDDGNIEVVDSSRDGNYMVFETTHFSVYAVVNAEEAETSLWWLWVLIAVVAALIVVAIVLLIKRRKKGEPEEPTEKAPDDEPKTDAAEEAPVEEAPAEEAPVEEAPVEEAPVEEAPAEEAPVEEAPAEEAPAEEAPAEEAPAEEAPVEEAPAEEAPVEEPKKDTVAPIIIGDDDSIVVDGNVIFIRYRSSFTSRLIQAEAPIQDYYTAIKNYLLSFKGVKARTSFNYEAFNKGRTQCVRLNVKGKALLVNLALNPADYNVSKYHFVDMSDDSKVAAVPMLLKVKSDRSLKYALELIDEVMRKLGIEQGNVPEVDYHMPYEPNSQLAKRGLVNVILPAGVKLDTNAILREADVSELLSGVTPVEKTEEVVLEEAPVEEAPVEEASVEEAPVEEAPAEEAPVEESPVEEAPAEEAPTPKAPVMPVISSDDSIMINGEAVSVRYRSSFTSRLIQAEASVQDYYTVLKNYLLSFKGVKARTSWNYENFTKGRTQCARLNVKGKTLTVNLALAPDSYNANKYHFTDVSDDPKFDKLPMLLKVRSDRALKYALELIDELMRSLGIVQLATVPTEDYRMPYEPNCELAKRGLVKLILPKGVKFEDATKLVEMDVSEVIAGTEKAEAPVEEAPAEEPAPETPVIHIEDHHIAEEEIVHVDATEADEIVSDVLAKEFIETVKRQGAKPKSSKCFEINLDVICENYEDGEVVTIESLKAKKLLPKKAERVKVLARGTMTKKLTVCADKFSMKAVKMIGLAGGVVETYDD